MVIDDTVIVIGHCFTRIVSPLYDKNEPLWSFYKMISIDIVTWISDDIHCFIITDPVLVDQPWRTWVNEIHESNKNW